MDINCNTLSVIWSKDLKPKSLFQSYDRWVKFVILLVSVDLEVIPMKGYLTLSKSPEVELWDIDFKTSVDAEVGLWLNKDNGKFTQYLK